MLLLAISTLLLACGYAGLLFFIRKGWERLPAHPNSTPPDPLPFLSVVMSARNEASSIIRTLQSLNGQRYPADRYEVIVIDDHSEDNTAALIQSVSKGSPIRFFSLAEHLPAQHATIAYKKAALQLGIEKARGEYIITTDADCTFANNWLRSYANAFQEGAQMVLAPVYLPSDRSFLQNFQELDVAGTMILTGAALGWGHPLLANGANMGFKRPFFQELGGYSGNEHRASGDDIFLLQKAVQQAPDKIRYLTSSGVIVSTEAAATWTALFHQRLRWAAKTGAYKDPWLILFQGVVYLLCLLLAILPLVLIGTGHWTGLLVLLAAWFIKVVADYFFLRYALRVFKRSLWRPSFFYTLLLHVPYIVVVGTLALLPLKVAWKGRRSR